MKKRQEDIFLSCGGQLRMSEALRHGLSRYMLYSLRDRGVIEHLSRGIYRLVERPPITSPDLVTVGLRVPNAVICLVSALAFHEITTQVPHRVSIALPTKSRPPCLDYPPLAVHRFSEQTYRAGVEVHEIDGVRVKSYSAERTLADCFKFRNKIGMDVVLEALKLYNVRKKFKLADLLNYGRICRVEKVMRPYLEAATV